MDDKGIQKAFGKGYTMAYNRKTILAYASALLALVVVSQAAERTISVTSFDDATGRAEVTVSTGDAVSGLCLYAAFDSRDMGTNLSQWRDRAFVAEVGATGISKTYTLPAEWHTRSGIVRFFLLEPERIDGTYVVDGLTASAKRGNPWIDTGIVPNADTTVKLRVRADGDTFLFGHAVNFYYFAWRLDVSSWGFFNGGGNYPFFWRASDIHDVIFGKNGLFIDGKRLAGPFVNTPNRVTGTMPIFARRNTNGVVETRNTESSTIYAATILTNGVAAREFVPVIANGRAKMYDKVTRRFFDPSNQGVFIAGERKLKQEKPVACSKQLVLKRSIKVTGIDRASGKVSLAFDGVARSGRISATYETTGIPYRAAYTLGQVAATENVFSATLPSKWGREGVVRFFWSSAEERESNTVLDVSAEMTLEPFAETSWTGGKDSPRLSTPTNWKGDVLPDFASGTCIAQIPISAEQVDVDLPVKLNGLDLRSESGNWQRQAFRISASKGGSLNLFCNGIVLNAYAKATPICDVTTPIKLMADQTWHLFSAPAARLDIRNVVSADAPHTLTIRGDGVLGLYATNTFPGTVQIQGGHVQVFSKKHPFGVASNGSEVVIDRHKAVTAYSPIRCEVLDAVLDKPMRVFSSGEWLLLGGISNLVSAPLTLIGAESGIRCSASVNVFTGGIAAEHKIAFNLTNDSHVIIRDAPVTTEDETSIAGQGELRLENSGNRFAALTLSSPLHCAADQSFNSLHVTIADGGWLDLGGHTHSIGSLDLQTPNSRISCDRPATLYLNDTAESETWNGRIEGALSIVKNGGASVHLGGRSTATGTLTVNDGIVTILPNGNWGGTSIMLTSPIPAARLALDGSAPFAVPAKTAIQLRGSAKITLLKGCAASVGMITRTDGTKLTKGRWGSSKSSAPNKDDSIFSLDEGHTGVLEILNDGQ
ncbi:MAG: hypothetical protein IKR48_03120 [Kiritimatiellae bacterium]|nr:hypothetical protein [Kiritimatiellia bacterium]